MPDATHIDSTPLDFSRFFKGKGVLETYSVLLSETLDDDKFDRNCTYLLTGGYISHTTLTASSLGIYIGEDATIRDQLCIQAASATAIYNVFNNGFRPFIIPAHSKYKVVFTGGAGAFAQLIFLKF